VANPVGTTHGDFVVFFAPEFRSLRGRISSRVSSLHHTHAGAREDAMRVTLLAPRTDGVDELPDPLPCDCLLTSGQ